MRAIGRKTWAIAEGYIPGKGTGPAPAMTSHEVACFLNAGERIPAPVDTELAIVEWADTSARPWASLSGAEAAHIETKDQKMLCFRAAAIRLAALEKRSSPPSFLAVIARPGLRSTRAGLSFGTDLVAERLRSHHARRFWINTNFTPGRNGLLERLGR